MDDISSEDAAAIAQATQREASPHRPSRGTKPAGFYKATNPLRPTTTSRSNMVPKNKVPKDKDPKDKGKRKRVDSPTSGDEGGQGGQGEQGGGSGVSGDGKGSGKGDGKGNGKSDGGADGEDDGGGNGESEGEGNESDDGKGNDKSEGKPSTKAKGKPGRNVKPKKEEEEEEVRERTPPSECETRPVKKDRDLQIKDEGPKMEEGDAPRFYAKIARVVEVTDDNGKNPYDKTIEENYRMPNHPPIILPAVDVSLLHTNDCMHRVPDREAVRFAMGPMVLPLLKQWAYMWLNPDNDSEQFHKDMQRTFPMEGDNGKPWRAGISLIADREELTYLLAPLLYRMSRFATRLVNANRPFFDSFSEYCHAINEPYRFAARLLLVVWEDVEKNENGFFRILFKGEMARPNRPEMRELYEAWYVVDERLFR
jgi:hypothetical protein